MVLTCLSFLCLLLPLLLFTMSPLPFFAHTHTLISCFQFVFNVHLFFFVFSFLSPARRRLFLVFCCTLHIWHLLCVVRKARECSVGFDGVKLLCSRYSCNRSVALHATKGNNDVELEMLLYSSCSTATHCNDYICCISLC